MCFMPGASAADSQEGLYKERNIGVPLYREPPVSEIPYVGDRLYGRPGNKRFRIWTRPYVNSVPI